MSLFSNLCARESNVDVGCFTGIGSGSANGSSSRSSAISRLCVIANNSSMPTPESGGLTRRLYLMTSTLRVRFNDVSSGVASYTPRVYNPDHSRCHPEYGLQVQTLAKRFRPCNEGSAKRSGKVSETSLNERLLESRIDFAQEVMHALRLWRLMGKRFALA